MKVGKKTERQQRHTDRKALVALVENKKIFDKKSLEDVFSRDIFVKSLKVIKVVLSWNNGPPCKCNFTVEKLSLLAFSLE